ncbi:MAG TPA: phosphoribosylglycinamide formyltransferase [Myxococcaceae bacterium]|nr:phosphoribosylglycinamide formyltransferase [Myxococcaceae bacterium]
MSGRLRVGVLVSGNGTNLQALIDAARAPDYPAGIALVLSNNPAAYALERARQAQIPAVVVDQAKLGLREQLEQALLDALRQHEVQLLCLAGFMRILSPGFLSSFGGPVLNIHPALLPSFPGLHAPRQALEHGVKISGCTVHLVDAGTDTGPIIVQAAVPVLPGDDEASLAARILREEHRIYPLAVRWVAEKAITLRGRVVRLQGVPEVADCALRNPGKRVP